MDLGPAGGTRQGGKGRDRHGAVHAGVLGPRRPHAAQGPQELSAVQGRVDDRGFRKVSFGPLTPTLPYLVNTL